MNFTLNLNSRFPPPEIFCGSDLMYYLALFFAEAVPMLQLLTLVANLERRLGTCTNVTYNIHLRELRVSFMCSSLGEMLTNIRVLLLPPRLFCSRWVSLEFLYGTWGVFCARAMMTLPRLESDLLMAWASVRRTPSLPLSFTLSLPARSTLKQKVQRIPQKENG